MKFSYLMMMLPNGDIMKSELDNLAFFKTIYAAVGSSLRSFGGSASTGKLTLEKYTAFISCFCILAKYLNFAHDIN